MINSLDSLEMEKKTVELMITMYCNRNHNSGKTLCSKCKELRDYSISRLNSCRYGSSKPVCRNCMTHCYNPIMKEKIIKVMRFSGPRMIFSHPIYTFYYIIRKIRASA